MSSLWGGSHLLVVALLSLSVGCAAPDTSQVESDSLIRGRAYGQIVDELKDLASRYPTTAKYFKYGESVGRRELALLRIGREDLKPAGRRPAVMISGSIHGDEFLNIEDRLPGWFLNEKDRGGIKKYLDSGGFIYIAPIMNPDGYSAVRRANNRGQDLNRDFEMRRVNKSGFTQPETTDFVKFLRSEQAKHQLEFKLTFDMHCCVGGVIYPWGHSATEKLAKPALDEHLRIGRNIVIANFPAYRFGQAHDVVGYSAVGASDDFYHETFGSVSFTFEGERGREKDKFAQHTKMWDALLADRAGNPVTGSTPSSTPQEAGELRLAILTDNANGLVLGAAANKALAMALCRGTPVVCLSSSPQIVTRFSGGRNVGSRVLFPAEAPLSTMAAGETYTLLALGDGGRAIGSQGVIFEAR